MPILFIRRSKNGFATIALYVDDVNLVGSPEEYKKTVIYLVKEFELKIFRNTKFSIALQTEHLSNRPSSISQILQKRS